jgi:hypothetical protein
LGRHAFWFWLAFVYVVVYLLVAETKSSTNCNLIYHILCHRLYAVCSVECWYILNFFSLALSHGKFAPFSQLDCCVCIYSVHFGLLSSPTRIDNQNTHVACSAQS